MRINGKNILLLASLLFLMLFSYGQSKSGIVIEKVQLSTDICYDDNSVFEVSFLVANKGLLPHGIYTDWCISENVVNQGVDDGEFFLTVTHNGMEYRYYKRIVLYKHDLPRKHLLWFRKARCSGRFYMNNFLKDIKDETNKDYGEYIIRVAYVKSDNDTIVSNPVSLFYLEK